jgi:acyl-CoA synthetase (AMP-forming)/AMP-acid ligase II
MTIDIDIPPCRQVRDAAVRYADRLALSDGDRIWTFSAFQAQVERLASGILASGVHRNDRACIWMHNCAETVLLSAALEAAGIVRVPLNARYTSVEAGKIMADCQPVALFIDPAHIDAVDHLTQLPQLRVIVTGTADWQVFCDGPATPDALYRAAADDLCSLNYTSGSTGAPKGVMLSHRNWMAVYRNMLLDRDIHADDRLVHIGPLSHSSGAYVAAWFLAGAANVVSPAGEGLDGLLRTIEHHRCTVLTCVPTLLNRLMRHPQIDQYDLSSLRQIGYGAEPIHPHTFTSVVKRFGTVLVQNYGLTEAMMTVCTLSAAEHSQNGRLRSGAIGRPYTHVEIVLRDENGREVPQGTVGELTVRADHVMRGYWQRPQDTQFVLKEGWLYSGDLARQTDDGIFWLAGRRSDMLICGGFNIYPQEVAAVVAGCPGVDDAAVLGTADKEWGEIPVAFVAGAHLDQDELVSRVKPQLGIRTPKRWVLLAELPRTVNGKVDTHRLRQDFLSASD